MAGAMSSIPSIAISYGVVTRPVDPKAKLLATDVAVEIVKRLWDSWGEDGMDEIREMQASKKLGRSEGMGGKVQVYGVNIPLEVDKLEEGRRRIFWYVLRCC